MKAKEVKKGMKFLFVPTGVTFEVAKVTSTRISWYIGFAVKSSWGKNTMRLAWSTKKQFQKGIDNGAYLF
jgi:hypothetical protein